MADQNDGGPAFPEVETAQTMLGGTMLVQRHTGMSLRDWFATAFLVTTSIVGKANADEIAANCYVMADAMLRARTAETKEQ